MSVKNTRLGAEGISRILSDKKHIFFIGIGGISMSSLAHISHRAGFSVRGSDRSESALTRMLEAEGIAISYSHDKDNVKGADLVVYTVAISEDNPEYTEAKRLGIPTVSRADYLGYIMADYKARIGISGAHGKSTCTSMTAHAFIHAKADPTVVSGAVLDEMGGAYRLGGKESFIFEACEYMDNFLSFYPNVAVILNVEFDHSDYFENIEQTYRSFSSFASIAGDADGVCIYNADDEKTRISLCDAKCERIGYGIESECEYQAKNIKYEGGLASFDIYEGGKYSAHTTLSVPGRHNVYNALASFAVCRRCGIDADAAAEGIGSFCGCKRRMELRGEVSGAYVYEDYAHHPTELEASIKAAREMTGRRVISIFQPHTYSRTHELYDGFISALSLSDEVIMADIYSARETDTLGVSSEQMARDIGERAVYLDSFEKITDYVKRRADKDTVVLVMGAGDIGKVAGMLVSDK